MNYSLSKKILILLIIIALLILILILVNNNKTKELPIANKNIELEVGDSQKIIINSNIEVTFKSNNNDIVRVDNDGIIYAIHQGFTKVTVTSNKISTTINVNVIDNSELKVHNIGMVSSNKLNKNYIKKGDKLIIKITFNHNLDKKPKLLINNDELTYQYNSNKDNIIIEKIIEEEDELTLKIYLEDKLLETYKLPIVDNQIPTCTMKYENNTLKIDGNDNYGIEGYALSKNKIFNYKSNKELNTNDYGIWYGSVRDYAGNIGECSFEIYDPAKHIEPSNVTIIGDSRMEDLCRRSWYKQDNGACIAEISKGYKWLNSTAIQQVNNLPLDKKKVIVTNLGVNDPHNAKKYADKYEELSQTEWSNSILILLSINPVSGKHSYLNPEISDFNNLMLQLASKYDNIGYCDSNSHLKRIGFESSDGLHYSQKTDKDIYDYIKKCIEDFFK